MQKLMVVLIMTLITITPAFAHEKRDVGEYQLVVGFASEPAFSGSMNGIDLRVKKGEEPVEGLEKTLRAEVRFEDETTSLPLKFKRKYKDLGKYNAYFLPSKPGKYIFVISGKIGDKEFSETFASGDKFHDVEDVAAITWPVS